MKLKEIVKAKVIEVLQDDSVIMSFQGNLIRIINKTKTKYREGMIVSLMVTRLKPLEFKLLQQNPSEF